jgi:hypothetical protein
VTTTPLPPPRILEIGEVAPFKQVLPDSTVLLWHGRQIPRRVEHRLFRLADLYHWVGRIRRGDFDLVVYHARQLDPWRRDGAWRTRARAVAGMAGRGGRDLAGLLTRFDYDVPLLFTDFTDEAWIEAHNLAALARSRAAFKRELPIPPTPVLRTREAVPWSDADTTERLVAKLRPISVGLSAGRIRHAEVGPIDKTADIFWAGSLTNPLRRHGIAQLERLRAAGYRVDIATEPMRHADFMRRCAAAWLVWSPEGFGWDCFRHYEASAVGSVAVINRPTIQLFHPLVDGEHCLYYDAEGDGLEQVVRDALTERPRLLAMGAAARTHVLRHHTHAALVAHMLAAVLDPTRFDLACDHRAD